MVEVSFDPTKDAANVAKHGLSFMDLVAFDGSPYVEIDNRRLYGESRFRAFGRINGWDIPSPLRWWRTAFD